MSHDRGEPPVARRRLLRTILKRPRNLRKFAPRVSSSEAMAEAPDRDEIAHWGEVQLLEDIVIALHRDGTSSWLTHVITAAHGDENLAEWDQVGRTYDQRKSRPYVRRAVVHTDDGVAHAAKQVVAPIDAHQRSLKLTFAPLRPGVVIELEMQFEEYKPDDTGPVMWANFALQSLWPCRRRRLTVAVAEPFAATIELHHCQFQPTESRVGNYRVLRWVLRNTEGIESDMWTPPMLDFAPWVDISTLSSWRPVGQHYLKELLPDGDKSLAVKKLAHELADNIDNDRDKVFAVYRYATRDVRYGRHPSEIEVAKIREASKMLEDLRGDCKDKSALMVSLLAEMNIRAEVAVLLTAVNGRTGMLPSRRFDHAIVRVDVEGQPMWFDPAGGPYTFGDLPQNDQGVQALILDGDNPRLVEVPRDPPEKQQVNRLCTGQLSQQGDYTFSARVTAQGERAAMYRVTLMDRNEDHRRRAIQQSVSDERPGAKVDEIVLGDVDDLENDAHYGYRAHLPQWGRRVEDLLLFRIPWAEPIEFTGPIGAAERLQPLQMPGVMRMIERHEIRVPDEFRGYALPYQSDHQCDWARYELRITCENGTLLCQRQLDSLGGIVTTERFTEVRQFWEACARDDSADVVLMKRAAE